METFTSNQLNTAFAKSSNCTEPHRLSSDDATMGQVVASYNGDPSHNKNDWESAAACAVGCVVGFHKLIVLYGQEAAAKPLIFTGNARCVGWARDAFRKQTTYVVDVFDGSWQRFLVRREQAPNDTRYHVRYWEPAEARPKAPPVPCQETTELLTEVHSGMLLAETWLANPDIFLGAINAFFGAEHLVWLALQKQHTAEHMQMVLDYGFNVQHKTSSTTLQANPPQQAWHFLDMKPFHERVAGTDVTEVVLVQEPQLGWHIATTQALHGAEAALMF